MLEKLRLQAFAPSSLHERQQRGAAAIEEAEVLLGPEL